MWDNGVRQEEATCAMSPGFAYFFLLQEESNEYRRGRVLLNMLVGYGGEIARSGIGCCDVCYRSCGAVGVVTHSVRSLHC